MEKNLGMNEPYRVNALGHMVPEKLMKAVDLLRDDLVLAMIKDAKELKLQMATKKVAMMQQVTDFLDLSASEYGVEFGGAKGNVTLMSFDGHCKVVRNFGEHRIFDERIQAAKAKIDSCIERWAQGSNEKIIALIDHAFRVNKQGRIDVNQVLSLRQLEIEDKEWNEAMEAIADAITTVARTAYLRFYERNGDGAYQAVSLDWAKL